MKSRVRKLTFLGFSVCFARFEYRPAVIILRGDKILSLRVFRTFAEHRWDLRLAVGHYARFLQFWPCYFESFSRDCDLCESTRRHRFWCYWIGYRKLMSYSHEYTEGPFHFRQISRREYLDFRPHWRDRIGEAFDDGNGTKVIL